MSVGRTALVALAAALGFAIGFYGGLAVLLESVGLMEVEEWQFELVTLPLGGLLAGVGATLATRNTDPGWGRVIGGSLVAALVMVAFVRLVDGDFGIAFVAGGLVVVATATTITAMAQRA